MTTEADALIDDTKELITEAVRKLQRILLRDVEGSHNYTKVYEDKLRKAFHSLVDIRNDIE